MVIDLLQRVGLNKYESEAYVALLQHGPLTGYELGKRSGVPLSRSYEILERLTARGLALQQPGDPPRYIAEAPRQFVDRTRAATTATLDALAGELAEIEQATLPEGFWVVRGRANILAHASTAIGQAQRTLALSIAPAYSAELEQALAQAQRRGCRITRSPSDPRNEEGAMLLLIADDQSAMVGTLAPAEHCQAVSGSNPGFLAALRRFFATPLVLAPARAAEPAAASREVQTLDWLDWEERKQRRLLTLTPDSHVA
jgi:sugar-specific transcriptional regulator TrmB